MVGRGDLRAVPGSGSTTPSSPSCGGCSTRPGPCRTTREGHRGQGVVRRCARSRLGAVRAARNASPLPAGGFRVADLRASRGPGWAARRRHPRPDRTAPVEPAPGPGGRRASGRALRQARHPARADESGSGRRTSGPRVQPVHVLPRLASQAVGRRGHRLQLSRRAHPATQRGRRAVPKRRHPGVSHLAQGGRSRADPDRGRLQSFCSTRGGTRRSRPRRSTAPIGSARTSTSTSTGWSRRTPSRTRWSPCRNANASCSPQWSTTAHSRPAPSLPTRSEPCSDRSGRTSARPLDR
jgi:hypothetical protein